MRRSYVVCLLFAGATLVAGPLGAQQKQDEKAMMDAYMKIAAPGEYHAYLKTFVGKWQTLGKFRMAPEAPWTESKGTGETEAILGGRFIVSKYTSPPMMGSPQPFEGRGLIGYDNQKKKYVSTWADNMGTMIMTAEGTSEDQGKTFTFKSNFTDPMTGKDTWMRSVYKVESPDKYVLEMYAPAPDGKEYLGMTIEHTRVKTASR